MKTLINTIIAVLTLCALTGVNAMELRSYGFDGTVRSAEQQRALEEQIQLNRESSAVQKMGVDLAELYHEHQQYQQTADAGVTSFQSRNTVNRVVDDYVVIDAVSTSADTSALVDELKELGMKNVGAAGRIVSGLLPITSIIRLADCQSLAFARPSVARTRADPNRRY